MSNRIKRALKKFFYPSEGSPRWMLILPYAVLIILGLSLLGGGAYGWEYANSTRFCGTTCHTMPPQNATFLVSPHSNVYCSECHIGRASLAQQLARKSEDVREIYATIFKTYEFPLHATRSRPARETCEKCHQPEAFSADSLHEIKHFQDDLGNTPFSYFLVMKTGGGAKQEGLGRGIHWHIVSQVEYYATDPLNQDIPYIRVYNEDGSITEFLDTESSFDPTTLDESQLKQMDCLTCHNRVSHDFLSPTESVEKALALKLIDPTIPEIRKKGVEILSLSYSTQENAMEAIAGLEEYYKTNHSDFFYENTSSVKAAVSELQNIYVQNVFLDQKVDWNTHPNNIGHINSPGCFRCHDGKHLDDQQKAVRLECNICHSIPVVATLEDFVTNIEISHGREPTSHLNPNWISLHNLTIDGTCANCHTMDDAGGTSNTSFCSNSACHGNTFTYAGFDAPSLRKILQSQLPVVPTPEPNIISVDNPTFEYPISSIITTRCQACHNTSTKTAGLDLTLYSGVMAGGNSGPVVIPGDPGNSLLVKVQSELHFANLTPEELNMIILWITNNTPEK